MLFRGIGPTIVGFAIQGCLKYGFYDTFKQIVKSQALSNGVAVDPIIIFMIAGLLAELIASTFLTPFEAVRIKIVSSPGFDTKFNTCVTSMWQEGGWKPFFVGLPPMLLRGVPYTVVQLTVFDFLTSFIYTKLFEAGFSGEDALHYQFLVTLVSALISAVLSCIVSQPGDTLVSIVNKSGGQVDDVTGASIGGNALVLMKDAIGSIGIKGLFTGLKARLYHVAFFVSIQLLVYDYVKQLCGIPVTGIH